MNGLDFSVESVAEKTICMMIFIANQLKEAVKRLSETCMNNLEKYVLQCF